MHRHASVGTALCLTVALATGAAIFAAPVQVRDAPRSTCDLLAPEEIAAVQQAAVREQKSHEEQQGGLRFRQCLFETSQFERSVSLTVIAPAANGDDRSAVRQYWNKSFHAPPRRTMQPPENARPVRKKDPPRPVAGTGEEAFWTGNPRAGALYVLSDGVVVRISIGGVSDEEERLQRSRRLAEAALRRLRG
ncbi:MAG TPA: hypothetical protein VM364_12810 [Vicinamibacterales bacterium]|nr:hypothetical protein [Vicinamibacterales bacterium]